MDIKSLGMGTEQEADMQNPTISFTHILKETDLLPEQGSSCEIDVVLQGENRVEKLILYNIPRKLLWQRTYIGNTDYSLGAVALFKPGLYEIFRSIADQSQDYVDRSRLLFYYTELILPLSIELDENLMGDFLVSEGIFDLNMLHRIAIPTIGSYNILTVRELLLLENLLPSEESAIEVNVSFPGLLPFQKMLLYNIPFEFIVKLRRLLPSEYGDGAISLFTPHQWKEFVRSAESTIRPLHRLLLHASLIVPLGLQQSSSSNLCIYHPGERDRYASDRFVGLNFRFTELPG